MKKRKSMYQRLNKKQKQHVKECFEGSPSRITMARVVAALETMKEKGQGVVRCFECESILRAMKGE